MDNHRSHRLTHLREETALNDMMTEIKILTRDHYVLSARHFIPAGPTGHTIIINPATGVKQYFYTHFALYLAEQGFHVYTFDYRGIGGSRHGSLKNFHASILDWGEEDFSAVIRYIKQRHPLHTMSIVGHSIGGQIIGLSPEAQSVDNIVMIGAQTPFWKHYNGATFFKVWQLWHLMIPVLTKRCGYFPARSFGLFEDLPEEAAMQWARWGKNKNYMFDELPHKREQYASLYQPALIYSFTDDPYAPLKAVKDLLQHYQNLKIEHRHIDPKSINRKSIGHFSFFRKSSEEIFWKDVSEWLRLKGGTKSSDHASNLKARIQH